MGNPSQEDIVFFKPAAKNFQENAWAENPVAASDSQKVRKLSSAADIGNYRWLRETCFEVHPDEGC